MFGSYYVYDNPTALQNQFQSSNYTGSLDLSDTQYNLLYRFGVSVFFGTMIFLSESFLLLACTHSRIPFFLFSEASLLICGVPILQ